MCGIIGFSYKSSSNDTKLLKGLSYLSHRGPDDSGHYYNKSNNLGLGHSRLSIIDLTNNGHQPMLSDDSSIVLIFNGEIYNYKELRKELIDAGTHLKGSSDTEVLLHLYLQSEKNGSNIETFLKKLNGIFAFAIWDNKKNYLLLVRDAFGVKPLYYSLNEDGLIFASEIKALSPWLKSSTKNLHKSDYQSSDFSLNPKLDPSAINNYLTFLWCPGQGTPFNNVLKLCPGEAMLIREGEVKKKFSWYDSKKISAPNKNLLVSGSLYSSQRAQCTKFLIKRTKELLREAVHRQMISDVPVGAFLSGGLDSSSVVAFAKEKNPNIHCFTIEAIGAGEEGIVDDLPYARRVADYLDVPLDVVTVDSSLMAEDLTKMVYQLDEPLSDPAPLNVLYISRLARQKGIKVLLSGAGGDDIFTGYRRHRALMCEKYFTWLPKPVLNSLRHLSANFDQRKPIFRRFRKLLNGVSMEGDARLINYFRWIDHADLIDLYSAEFKSALRDSNNECPMLEYLKGLPESTTQLERMLALEKRFFLADHNLNYTDKMSMAEGVEVRVPFLDINLVDFASCIPDTLKQRGGEGKWILKKAMEPHLPKDVIYRSKSGFGAPLRRWMANELREMVCDYLSPSSINRRGLFDSAKVQSLIRKNASGEIDASYTLLSLLCIEIWCQRFLDKIS